MTLAVEGMYCAACPYIVERSLASVPGVTRAQVSRDGTAVVSFDDSLAGVEALTRATAEAGYPSAPAAER